ncbi:CoA transferase, partial [Chloroflexota bacterium]
MIKGPLNGIRVIDLTRAIAGPWGTQILGDMGAEIIKIEVTPDSDAARGRYVGQPSHKGENYYFLAFNRNKKSLSLDLRTPS